MSNIYYAPSGRRSPAHRSTQVIRALAEQHDVVVHADADDFERLAPRFHGHARVVVRRLPGSRWQHARRGDRGGLRARLEASASFLDRRWRRDELRRHLATASPDLVLHEDEGLVAEAARRIGLPLLTLGAAATGSNAEAAAEEVARFLTRLERLRLPDRATSSGERWHEPTLVPQPALEAPAPSYVAERSTGPRALARVRPA